MGIVSFFLLKFQVIRGGGSWRAIAAKAQQAMSSSKTDNILLTETVTDKEAFSAAEVQKCGKKEVSSFVSFTSWYNKNYFHQMTYGKCLILFLFIWEKWKFHDLYNFQNLKIGTFGFVFIFFLNNILSFFNKIMAFLSDMPEWSVSNEDDYNETGTFDSNGIFVSNKVKKQFVDNLFTLFHASSGLIYKSVCACK